MKNNNNIETLVKKISELERDLQLLRLTNLEREKAMNSIISERDKYKTDSMEAALRENELKAIAESWEIIVDELAHSINTDIFIAVSSMSSFLHEPEIKKASYHTKQVRDLTNLLLLYLKRDEVQYSYDFVNLDLTEIITQQIAMLRDGISTLRLSSKDHKETLLKMEIPVNSSGSCSIEILQEFKDAVSLVIKDLMRNAMKHTSKTNPAVKVTLEELSSSVKVKIVNNKIMSQKFIDWFNNSSQEDPDNMSKSSKVGLRVVKKWVDLLKIETKYEINESTETTTVTLNLPKRITYEKNQNSGS